MGPGPELGGHHAGGTDTADLVTAVVAGDAGNLCGRRARRPAPAGTPFDLRTFWDEDEMDAGETWYGSLSLGTGPGSRATSASSR